MIVVRFVLFLTLCFALVGYHFLTLANPRFESLGMDGTVYFFTRDDVRSDLVKSRTQIATGFIYRADVGNASLLRKKFTHIDGESIVINGYVDVSIILRQFGHRVVRTQYTAQTRIYYAFSGSFRSFITSGGDRINLQIAKRAGRTTIGWPVILGSY